MAKYESAQAVLEEAGLSHAVFAETPSGTINGSNNVFVTSHHPLADYDEDGEITVDDVVVYVDGVTVSVDSIDADAGRITLTVPPASGTTVTVDYRYSNVTNSQAQKRLDEAEAWVDEELEMFTEDDYYDTSAQLSSARLRQIVRFYAAGLLLLKDYGFAADTEQTSKDGNAKIELAERWMDRYKELLKVTLAQANRRTDMEVEAEPDLFTTWDSEKSRYTPVDDEFMQNLDPEYN